MRKGCLGMVLHKKRLKKFLSKMYSKIHNIKVLSVISLLFIVIFFSPLYLKSFINLMNSLGAGTVSDVFLNELLHEPDTTIMLQKARDAGLVVESYIGDTSENHVIKDPATDEVLLTETAQQFDWGYLNFPLQYWSYFPGQAVTCDTTSDSRVRIKNSVLDGINQDTRVTFTKPSGMSDATYNRLKSALREAINKINGALDTYDTPRTVPRFVDGLDGSADSSGMQTIIRNDLSGYAQARHRHARNGAGAEFLDLNATKIETSGFSDTSLATIMTHELAHDLGLDHKNSLDNLMKEGGQYTQNDLQGNIDLNLNRNQVEALIAGHDSAKKIGLSNCSWGEEKTYFSAVNACGADVVLVRDIQDHLAYYENSDSPNPRFKEESYNSLVNLYKGLADRLSNTPTRFLVIDPGSIIKESYDVYEGLEPNLYYYDKKVPINFSSDTVAVKSALDDQTQSRSLLPNYYDGSYPPNTWSDPHIDRVKGIQNILTSGRDDFPNLIVYVGWGGNLWHSFIRWIEQVVPRDYLDSKLWPIDEADNFKGDVNTNGGHVLTITDSGQMLIGGVSSFGTWSGTDTVTYYGNFNYEVSPANLTYSAQDLDTLTNAVQETISGFYIDATKSLSVTNVSVNSNSSNEISTDGSIPHTISVTASDPTGSNSVNRIQAIINRQGDNSGIFRGYLAWSNTLNPFVSGKNERACSGGGYAAINADPAYGSAYITLDSCSVSTSGNNKTINFTVRFDPSFTSPVANNLISGSAQNCLGGAGWQTGFIKSKFNLGDTVFPTVSITAPANNSAVSGAVTITANASDNVGVTGVQFKLDGANLGTEITAPSYSMSWDTKTISNGSHTLTAVASDAKGNTTTSAPITVTINNDTIPPIVSIINVAGFTTSGSTVTYNSQQSITAVATDNVGVTSVEFKISKPDGTLLATVAPTTKRLTAYVAYFDPLKLNGLGQYIITVGATDAAGNKTTSIPFNVTVADKTKPKISVTAPTNNSSIAGKTSVTINTNASDDVRVHKIEILVDNVIKNTCTSSTTTNKTLSCSYNWSLLGVAAGKHTIQAKAYDSNLSATNTGVSAIVSVTR